VDLILVQLRRFWNETSSILEHLSKEGQVAEETLEYVHNPRILENFQHKINDYKIFWKNVGTMCHNYLAGVREPTQRFEGFLENGFISSGSGGSTGAGAGINNIIAVRDSTLSA
jgi:hypothetical protein